MKYLRLSRRARTWGIVAASLCTTVVLLVATTSYVDGPTLRNAWAGDLVDFTGADNVSGFPSAIVPNVLHMIHFSDTDLRFVELVAILAADRNHKPDRIVMHCDCLNLTGKYWDVAVRRFPRLEVEYLEMPTHIFGKKLSSVYHSSDIARIRLLMRYGGIYIDSDVYVVRSLNYYLRFEFAIGWPAEQYLGTQVLVAHKNARFLPLWLDSYRYYQPEKWYYNAGELPTTSILQVRPFLVHRVPLDFGVHNVAGMLYGASSQEWKDYHAIHLLWNHRDYLVESDKVKVLDENSIQQYGRTFGQMARLVLFGTTEPVHNRTLRDILEA